MAYSMVVLVKQTPDLNAVRVDKASGKPLLGDQLVMSSADAIAVEAALQLKEAHGGEITVSSVVGRGSEFTIRLPREVAADVDEAMEKVNETSPQAGAARNPGPIA